MVSEIKLYINNAKAFVDDIRFPVLVGGGDHQEALRSLVYAVETLSDEVEKLKLLNKGID